MLKLFKKKQADVAIAGKVPQHIAFICDGNRRWAEMRGLPPLMGHQAGIANFENLVDWFMKRGVSTVTFYIFSTENWKRDKEEVYGIFDIVRNYLKSSSEELYSHNIKLSVMGDYQKLPEDLAEKITEMLEKTKNIYYNVQKVQGDKNERKN